MECSPGGKSLMSSLIFTPCLAGVSVAVPMLRPSEFLISTKTGFVWPRACGAVIVAAAKRNDTVNQKLFIQPPRDAFIGCDSNSISWSEVKIEKPTTPGLDAAKLITAVEVRKFFLQAVQFR